MERLHNWQTRLSDYIISHSEATFQYGSFDCGLFCAGAIEAMTGVDVAGDLRGQYGNRRDAFRAIKALCGTATVEGIAQYLADKYDIKETPVLMARRGDPVLIGSGRTSRLGILAMYGTEIILPYNSGLVRYSLDQATRAWHI